MSGMSGKPSECRCYSYRLSELLCRAVLVLVGVLSGLPHHSGYRALMPFMRSCRPNAPFPELLCPSRTSIADEVRIERTRRVLG